MAGIAPELGGRVAVVTGGASGLGAAMARVFAGEGMSVAVLDIDRANAAAVADEIRTQHGVPTTSVHADVGDADSMAAAARRVREALGGCDVLSANVGVQQFGAVDALTEQDWQWLVNVNVLGMVRTVREFLPLIRSRSGFRRIVLTSSSSALVPAVRIGGYQTTKFAVMGLGESLRHELAAEGIGVSVLFPGGMITRHLESSVLARPAELGPTEVRDDDLLAMMAHRPLAEGDLATPEHAIRNLLADLIADEPYILTHGVNRSDYNDRRDAIEAAFDRMLASRANEN